MEKCIKYNCILCNFNTNRSDNYNVHLKSKKHLNKQFPKKIDMNIIENNKKEII
jgi:hypothetical protein